MQITEDHTPFSRDAPRHSWSISRDPDGPAAASIPAQSIATLLPADSGPADGSSGRVAPPASPPLTCMRRPRGTASPPAQDKPGPPGSANKTAPKTPRTSETSGAAHSTGISTCKVVIVSMGAISTAVAVAEQDGPRVSGPNYRQSPEDIGDWQNVHNFFPRKGLVDEF